MPYFYVLIPYFIFSTLTKKFKKRKRFSINLLFRRPGPAFQHPCKRPNPTSARPLVQACHCSPSSNTHWNIVKPPRVPRDVKISAYRRVFTCRLQEVTKWRAPRDFCRKRVTTIYFYFYSWFLFLKPTAVWIVYAVGNLANNAKTLFSSFSCCYLCD